MKDPVLTLFEEYPYHPDKVLASSSGGAYVAIMLINGQIGVCSTLNTAVETDPMMLTNPDLKRHDHRILITAFANAHANYIPENPESGDIFDNVDFSKKKQTVMIGYFPPLVEKFRQEGFSLTVFDKQKDLPDLTPMTQMGEFLGQSDSIILSATSLINSTFGEVISKARQGADIYLLGPSTPLYPSIKNQYNITRLFGMVFKPYDFEILKIIGAGAGTQSFSKKGKKVSL